MDEATYKIWWPLHARKANGEVLSVEEEQFYQAELATLDAEEDLDGGLEELRLVKERMNTIERENVILRERKAALDARISQLEAQLDSRARKVLTSAGS